MADNTVQSLSLSQYYQPAITFTGLGSSVDLASMVEKLVEAESRQRKRLEAWKEEWTAKIAALEELNTKLGSLRQCAAAMDTMAKFAAKSVAVSDSTVVSATAGAAAANGTHVLLVQQLAQNEVEVHQGLASADTVVNGSGATKVFAFRYAGGSPISLPVPDGTTLSQLAALINASGANPGITATVVDMGPAYGTDRYRLMLSGNDTGSAQTIVIDDTLTTLDGTGGTENFTSSTFTETQTAQNAQVRLNGYPPSGWIERAENLLTDVLPGVTLSLLATSATPVRITVTYDTGAMQGKVRELVQAYNAVVAYIKAQTDYNATTGKAGVLFGNYAVQIVKSQLSAIAVGNAPGFRDPEDSYLNLAQIGITTEVDEARDTFGQLRLDEATLAEALQNDPKGVAELLSAYFQGVSDDATGTITFFSALPGITQPGVYEVEATVTGGVLVSGTINGHAAVVEGDTLTGAAGYPEYGLAVRVNLVDGTHSGQVRLKLGLNGQFREKLDDLLSLTSGPVHILIDNYQDVIHSLEKKIELEQRRIDSYRQRLLERFSRLEAVLAELNDQANYLAAQIQKLGFKNTR